MISDKWHKRCCYNCRHHLDYHMDGRLICSDEQGKCKGKDRNHKATELFRLTLLTTDFLVGDVLVCDAEEIK